MTNAEIQTEISKLKVVQLTNAIDTYRDAEKSINDHYDMGVIHFTEKVEQLKNIILNFEEEVKKYNLQNII